jgi:hypothetical protein
MENFVCKGFNIARDRLYKTPSEGGLGMFRLDTFIKALQCSWIKRIFDCCNDNWKYDILSAAEFEIENIPRCYENGNVGAICKNIMKSFTDFHNCLCNVQPKLQESTHIRKYSIRIRAEFTV